MWTQGTDVSYLAQVLLGGGDVDFRSQFFHSLPVVGRLVHAKVWVIHPRDEAWQARKVVETLEILDAAGVDGAFVSQFESQINPFDETRSTTWTRRVRAS
jgi:hypothetical protein